MINVIYPAGPILSDRSRVYNLTPQKRPGQAGRAPPPLMETFEAEALR